MSESNLVSVFHGSASCKVPNDLVLTHMSTSITAAAERIESLFTGTSNTVIQPDGAVKIINGNNMTVECRTVKQHVDKFCEYLKGCRIHQYTINVESALRVNDLWDDDPIGSGGPGIVDSTLLTDSEVTSIQSIFSPFTDVVTQDELLRHCDASYISRIKKKYKSSSLFKCEMRKRFNRSKMIGESPEISQFNEYVWLDLTFKFRDWALSRRHDALVYCNEKEGSGADSYVMLKQNCKLKPVHSLQINIDKYRSEVPDRLGIQINKSNKAWLQGIIPTSLLWADLSPADFWY